MKYNYLVVVVLAVVVSWYRRSARPSVNDLIDHYFARPTDDVVFSIPIYMYTHEFYLPDVAEATELQLKSELAKIQYDEIVNFKFDLRYGNRDEILLAKKKKSKYDGVNKFDENAHLITFRLRDIEALFNNPINKTSEFFFKTETLFSNDLPFFLTQTVMHQVFHSELSRLHMDQFVKSSKGVKYTREDIDTRESLKLNFVIQGNKTLDTEYVIDAFDDLRQLYNLDVVFDEPVNDVQDGVFNILLVLNEAGSIQAQAEDTVSTETDSEQKGEEDEPPAMIGNTTLLIRKTIRSPNDLSQLVFDIKHNLFNHLHFISDPKVIPLRIDMEIRFRILLNLLRFIDELHEVSKSVALDRAAVVEMFEYRFEILRVVREDYDWAKALQMTKQLLQMVPAPEQESRYEMS